MTIRIGVGWKIWKMRRMVRRSPRIRICFLGAVVVLLLLVVAPASAQAKSSSPPAGMTQQEYDDLVKAVGELVLQTLTEKGLVAKPSASPAAAIPVGVDEEALLAERVRNAFGEIPKVLGAYPEIWADLAALPNRLDQSPPEGRGLWSYLVLLVLAAAESHVGYASDSEIDWTTVF